jgi:hypothetical protein
MSIDMTRPTSHRVSHQSLRGVAQRTYVEVSWLSF